MNKIVDGRSDYSKKVARRFPMVYLTEEIVYCPSAKNHLLIFKEHIPGGICPGYWRDQNEILSKIF